MYRFTVLLLIVFVCQITLAQGKVEKRNSTYMNVDFDQTWSKVMWPKNVPSYKSISFSDGKFETDSCLSLKLNKSLGGELKGLELFQLDTNNREHGWFKFYASKQYFDTIRQVDLAFGSKKDGEELVLEYTQLLPEKKNYLVEFANVLIHFGVIVTYHHLNAEMVYKVQSNSPDELRIKYNVVWHFCTNDCYDPEYSFELLIDKASNKVSVIKL